MTILTTTDGDVVQQANQVSLKTPQIETKTAEDDRWMDDVDLPEAPNMGNKR